MGRWRDLDISRYGYVEIGRYEKEKNFSFHSRTLGGIWDLEISKYLYIDVEI